MPSCLSLERPGKWRTIGVVALLVIAALPALPLLLRLVPGFSDMSTGAAVLDRAFGTALWNSLRLALGVGVVSFLVGLPVGVLAALHEFPARRILLGVCALPLLIPPLLWSIGWSALLSGFSGCLLVFSASAIPLALFTSYAASSTLSASQLNAARLAGSRRAVLFYACRHAFTPTLLAAGLGAILGLSDPGPGQILGLRTAAAELLISFSALYDFDLAAKQCAVLTGLVLLLAVPLAAFAAPRVAREMLARQPAAAHRLRDKKTAALTTTVLCLYVLVAVGIPLLGLVMPVFGGADFGRALGELRRTAVNTFIYGLGAGLTSALLGLLLAFFVGRSNRLRTACIAVCLTLFCVPPAFQALGIVQIATAAPAGLDPLLRSRLTVCLALGIRFVPVAAILALRAWGSTSPSWALAGAVHGLPLKTYLRRIALPFMLPSAAMATLLVALLATADIGTVLLLHPPGETSLPLAVFTVMANARESTVASLCLVYVAAAAALLAGAFAAAGRRRG